MLEAGNGEGARAASRHGALSPLAEWVALLVPAALLGVLAVLSGRGAGIVAPGEALAAVPSLAASRPLRGSQSGGALRVCADPNNMPYSNAREQGFENRIASLFARDLGMRVEYTWWAQRRGYVRNTLKAGLCDVVMGIPSSSELVLVTRPYYRSTYVFVTRKGGPRITSFDDPALHRLRVGVQVIGDDFSSTPPVHALSTRGVVRNVVGFSVYGDYRDTNPTARIVDAVAKGEVDVAVVWGPQAGYFAKHAAAPLRLAPVSPQIDLPFLPMVFDFSMGVRRGDVALRQRLDSLLVAERPAIDRILDDYGVPRIGASGTTVASGAAHP